jgi:pimeloyl-ACP methyl ester carboxylesterase
VTASWTIGSQGDECAHTGLSEVRASWITGLRLWPGVRRAGPRQGQSPALTPGQILGGSGSALDVPHPTAVLDIVGYPGTPEGDAEAFLKPSTVHNAFAQDLSEADRWLIVASQRPITLGANTAPTQTAAWKTIPSRAVVGTEDRVIPPATQRSMAERAGSTITEVAGSHVSMVSHPAAAIDAILAAAAAIDD